MTKHQERQLNQSNKEILRDRKNPTDLIEKFANDEAIGAELEDLYVQLDGIPGLELIKDMEMQIKTINEKSMMSSDFREISHYEHEIKRLKTALSSNENYKKYRDIQSRITKLGRLNTIERGEDSLEAQLLHDSLLEADGQNSAMTPAPFVDYRENTRELWNYVPDEAVRDYLDNLKFIDTNYPYFDGNAVEVSANNKDHPLTVPISLFVSAAGFDSWKGRNDRYSKSWRYGNEVSDSRSIDVMKHYASLPTELPPIGCATIFIQPDGKIFADNGSGDSHRLGAAFLRGQKEINALRIRYIRLTKNLT